MLAKYGDFKEVITYSLRICKNSNLLFKLSTTSKDNIFCFLK